MDAEKVKVAMDSITAAETDAATFLKRKLRNYNTRHCLWPGQSPDGRKRQANMGEQPFPWEGASDARVRLADQIVNENKALLVNAFFRAKVQMQPVESGDAAAKVSAETALRWMLWQHCADDLRREVDLVADYQENFGLGLMYVGWRRTTQTEKKVLRVGDLEDRLLETRDPDVLVLLESIMDPLAEEEAKVMLRDMVGPGAGKLAVVRALRNEGVAEYENAYVFENRPEFVALEPFEDVFFPASTGDLQRARWIAWRELVNETELRERELTAEYDGGWIDMALKQKGEYLRGANSYYRTDRVTDDTEKELIELWHYYWRETGENGATQVRYAVLNGGVPGEAAVEELLPFAHGQYPFVEFVRERTTRCLIESRGVPEIVESAQLEVKTQRDFRADRASISVLPPVRVPANRGKLNLIFGPGAQVAERRPNEFGWMEPPRFDQGTIEIERATLRDIDLYFGRTSAEVPQPVAMLVQQTKVDGMLRSGKAVFAQAFALMQQYLTDVEIVRVTGALPAPFQVSREAIQGKFDVVAEFDVRDLDTEALGKKLDFIAKLAVPLDVAGVIDRANLVRFVVGAVDPSLAQQIVRSQEAATAAEVEEEQLAFTKIAAGTEPPLPEQGVNAGLRLQTLQGIVQANPAVQQRYQGDEIFRAMLDARVQALQFQMQQSQNAQIGRVGAVPALAGGQGVGSDSVLSGGSGR